MTGNAEGSAPSQWFSIPFQPVPGMNDAIEYWVDAWQRSILLLDVLRQRGNNYVEHNARDGTACSDLRGANSCSTDARCRGRSITRWSASCRQRAYRSTRRKRPFIVFDPRAGHGPGIGGMKHDSEIGVALAAGHPCYFVGFLPEPMPGQTIEDVCLAEARFVEEVVARHPDAEGKPCLIGNCQAGWQIMMMSAIRPDLPGPIMLAGSPLSYWAGVHGKNPMRYLGGLLGGTWLTSLAGDLGHGMFDGANLVANFEAMHPDNTYWKKIYNLYSKIDTEADRFLDFEKWWGSPVLLTAGEMQSIADDLFVGNKLAPGELRTSTGVTGRSAQHPVADHRVLFLGRRHHAAAAGAGLDPRSLRPRGRDRRGRADHRLLPASKHRPSRHLRFRQGGDKGTRRIRPGDGLDRRHAAGSLRGRHHRRR